MSDATCNTHLRASRLGWGVLVLAVCVGFFSGGAFVGMRHSGGAGIAIAHPETIDSFYSAAFERLSRLYYGVNAKVVKIDFGPSGVLIGRVLIDGQEESVVMLPDARTVIRGEIRSVLIPDIAMPSPGKKTPNSAATEVAIKEAPARTTDQFTSLHAEQTLAAKDADPMAAARPPLAPAAQSSLGSAPAKIVPPEGMKSAVVPNKPAIYAAAEKSHGYVSFGAGPKKLYVFFDPNCPACMEAQKFMNRSVAGADVEVRYLPLSILGPDSQDKASYILDSSDNAERVARFDMVHGKKKMTDLVPGFTFKTAPGGDRAAMVNFALLRASGTISTPRFMYMTASGPMISVINNEQGLMEIVQSITPE